MNSHYGSEFFCPISLFRIYGLSEFEVIDTAEEPEDPEEPEEPEIFSESQPDEKRTKGEAGVGVPAPIPCRAFHSPLIIIIIIIITLS